MSLQYIIDGYNITNHTIFTQHIKSKTKDQKIALLELIKKNKLTGSLKNKITLVFDGYPHPENRRSLNEENANFTIIFSRQDTADERIRKIVENSSNPRNTVVVSDDKEIKFFVKSIGAKALSVEEFLNARQRQKENKLEAPKPELSFSQMLKINQELRKIWLK